MSALEINRNSEYDDLMESSPTMEGSTMITTNQASVINTVNNTTHQKPKQESVTIFEVVPSSVMNNVNSVSYPPTKQTRFSLATPELERQLEQRIKEIIPCARIEFKPNKAEVADATIMEGNKEQKDNECDVPSRRIGCMNFIHQDRPKEGSVSKKYIEVMFFNFEKKEEYERIKSAVVEFFKQMDTGTVDSTSLPNDIPLKRQRFQGGKRLKKTQKKKQRSNKKKRSTSKRHGRRK